MHIYMPRWMGAFCFSSMPLPKRLEKVTERQKQMERHTNIPTKKNNRFSEKHWGFFFVGLRITLDVTEHKAAQWACLEDLDLSVMSQNSTGNHVSPSSQPSVLPLRAKFHWNNMVVPYLLEISKWEVAHPDLSKRDICLLQQKKQKIVLKSYQYCYVKGKQSLHSRS